MTPPTTTEQPAPIQCMKHSETFRYMGSRFKFDITRAIEFVQDGREPVELDEDDVHFSLEKVHINRDYLPEVDPQTPGIIAVVFFPDQGGAQIKGQRLIDGHHRAARCLELGIPFRVFLLNEEESAAILLKSPCRPQLDPETCIGLVPSSDLPEQG